MVSDVLLVVIYIIQPPAAQSSSNTPDAEIILQLDIANRVSQVRQGSEELLDIVFKDLEERMTTDQCLNIIIPNWFSD